MTPGNLHVGSCRTSLLCYPHQVLQLQPWSCPPSALPFHLLQFPTSHIETDGHLKSSPFQGSKVRVTALFCSNEGGCGFE